jgi:plastocyanin
MKKIFIISFVLIATFIFTGCSFSGEIKTTEQSEASTMEINAINIQDFAFTPSVATVKRGTTITWTNNDSVPHLIKFDKFDSKELKTGESFSFSFSVAGTYDYYCSIHPSMKGTIIVE